MILEPEVNIEPLLGEYNPSYFIEPSRTIDLLFLGDSLTSVGSVGPPFRVPSGVPKKERAVALSF